MRRPIVAGNWKMNGSRAENDALLDALSSRLPADAAAEVVVCPPFVYLPDVVRTLRDSNVAVGAQDVCAEAAGAYTGEVSAAMLRDVGCRWVIVGHSERRALYSESESLVARKFAAALARDLLPILCVGEQLADREAGRTADVVARQLDAVVESRPLPERSWPTSRSGRSEPAGRPAPSRPRRFTASSVGASRKGMLILPAR
jgi:triosephosphate isomerase (TIM)